MLLEAQSEFILTLVYLHLLYMDSTHRRAANQLQEIVGLIITIISSVPDSEYFVTDPDPNAELQIQIR
jgi:hypothetical protein